MQNPLVSSSVLALALCSSVFGQTVQYETSPPGHVARFNHDFYTQLGIWPKGRLHQGDGELMKRMAISRMDYRLDPAADYRFTPSRKWTSVVLRLAETTLPLNTRFSSNYLTTPQTVFAGAMSWTTPAGAYPTPPANTQTIPWGSHGLAFPFTSVFMYSGTKPMLREYVFRGGTLSNTATWTTNSTFFLDGIENKNTGGGGEGCGARDQQHRLC